MDYVTRPKSRKEKIPLSPINRSREWNDFRRKLLARSGWWVNRPTSEYHPMVYGITLRLYLVICPCRPRQSSQHARIMICQRSSELSEWKKQAGHFVGKSGLLDFQVRSKIFRWFPTKETGLLSGVLFVDRGRKLSLYAWETAFPAICFMNWRVAEYREFKEKDLQRPALSPPIISMSWESEIETNTREKSFPARGNLPSVLQPWCSVLFSRTPALARLAGGEVLFRVWFA